ncbi:hypothetical protein AGMMS49957_18460 [Synergistales bacterium]|nr:hypothetical protein AGMMS49957_18460 [Synergistales bacterium]
MGFYEDVINAARNERDAAVKNLVLGWHSSFLSTPDGRWGIGCVPNSRKEAHLSRESHTSSIMNASLFQLAELIVSPFPQEFAAATAACAALLPFPHEGFPLDAILPCARGDKVAALGYEREVVPMMRDWGWKLAIFDDLHCSPDCFPVSEFPEGAKGADWVWLTPEALRDRWLPSTADILKTKKGCFLQGPGLPYLAKSFAALGVTHLVTPAAKSCINGQSKNIRSYIAAGGDPWLCPELEWRVHFTNKQM